MDYPTSQEVKIFDIGINYRGGNKFVITEEVAQDFIRRVNTDTVYGEILISPDIYMGNLPEGVPRIEVINHDRIGVLLLPNTAVIRDGKAYCQFRAVGEGKIIYSSVIKSERFTDYLSCRYTLKDKTDLVDKIITIDLAEAWNVSMEYRSEPIGEKFDDCLTIYTDDPNDPILNDKEAQ